MISIGVYSRQFFFFLGLGALLLGAGSVIGDQVGEAAGRPIAIPPTAQTMAVDLYLEDAGKVRLDSYVVPGTVSFFADHDELRYVLVDQPDTFLDRLQVTVHFPRPVTADDVRASAIIVHDIDSTWEVTTVDASSVVYDIRNLGPTATLTLVTEFPKGSVLPSLSQRVFGTITSLPQTIWLALALILPLLTLIVLVIVLAPQLRQRMTDPGDAHQPTPPQALPPAVVAALVDGQVSARAIAATLLDLARREYIEIGSHGGTYTFTKRRRLLETAVANDLAPFEQTLLSKIFTGAAQASEEDIRVRIGHRLFSQKIASVYLGIYEGVTRLGYFIENPSVVSGSYRLTGLALFFLGIIGFLFGAVFFANPPTPLLFWTGTILAALVVIAVAPRMPAHTSTGLARRREWLRFRNYLKDTTPIDYRGQTQQEYFTYLPYAVALGVEAGWSHRFMEGPFQLPEWYAPSATVARWEDFFQDMFPIVGYLAQELAAIKEPTLS